MKIIRPTKADLLLAAAVLAVAAVVLVVVGVFFDRSTDTCGAVATVELDGITIATVPLHEDVSMTFETGHTIKVRDGAILVVHAPCLDHICTHYPAADHVGDTIVCLPYRLVITVREVSHE